MPCATECCENMPPPAVQQPDTKPLCLAVVRESGSELLLFDASGASKAFRLQGNTEKLCFSTHGHVHAADLLTPCLDEDGLHGLPDEGCFCGVETPHIHAHVHDPKKCDGSDSNFKDFTYLAKVTLHPSEDQLELEESSQLPNQCNSEDITGRFRDSGVVSSAKSSHGASILGKRMYQIQHGEHLDYLVHNEGTGQLHLEHECGDCGENDVHGKFVCVSERCLGNIKLHFFQVAPSPFDVLDFFAGFFDTSSTDRVQVARHVIAPRAPSPGRAHSHDLHACCAPVASCCNQEAPCCAISDCCDGVKDCGVTRVGLDAPENCCEAGTCGERHAQEDCCVDGTCEHPVFGGREPANDTVRSSFVCKKICCAAEIPMLNTILEPLVGIEKIMINVPVKIVTVDHNPQQITADHIANALNKNLFGASIQRDGGKQVASPFGSTGRSTFFVQKICCASEIPAINAICEPIPGVSKVSINVTTKMVYVDHNIHVSSAQAIADALNAERFGAHVKHDAADDVVSPFQIVVESTLTLSSPTEKKTEELEAFLANFDRSQMKAFTMDAFNGKINIEHNAISLPAQSIIQSIEKELGFEVKLEKDGGADTKSGMAAAERDAIDDETSNPSFPTILSGLFWILSMFALIGDNWVYLKYLGLISCAFGLPSIGLKAFRTLRRFQFDTNVLMFVAAVGAIALQEYNEAAAVTFLFSISEWLEVRATTRARNALSSIVRLRPDKANLFLPGSKEIIVIAAGAVPVGALVSVRPGDKVPCDGLVISGYSTIDESSLTGEARPVKKSPSDNVSGGTINSGMSELIVRTTSTADNSAVAKLIRLVEEAQANRSVTEKMIDEFAKRYTPLVILAALSMCTIPWAFGKEIGKEWTNNGLVLLVIACPCSLIISTPVTYVAGLAATAQRGILIKGGAHLEALGMVREIAFDKTGTLTQGHFALLHLKTLGKLSRENVLQHLALMEERATHPLAVAIIRAVQNEGFSVPATMWLQNHTHLAGEGVMAEINGLKIYVGNERLFRRLGMYDAVHDDVKKASTEWSSLGGTVGFMSIGDQGIVCAYSVADAIRSEAAEVIKSLRALGIEPTMLTGDNADAARAIGNQIGLDGSHIRSELLPEDKLRLVESMKDGSAYGSSVFGNPFKPKRLVLMCGDGVNDAPALAIADVGVAMGAGAALAMETSDVTLLDSNLDKLLYSLHMGRKVIRKIRENVIFSFVVKIIVVGFTLSGEAHLWAAIASDVGTMLLVTLNSMTLLPGRKSEPVPVELFAGPKDLESAHVDDDNCTTGSGYSPVQSFKSASGHKQGSGLRHTVEETSGGTVLSRTDKIPEQDHSHKHSHHGSCSHDHSVPKEAEKKDNHGHSHVHARGRCSHDHSVLKEAEQKGDHGHSHGHAHGSCSHEHSAAREVEKEGHDL